MSWMTKEDLKSHVLEYGPHSCDYIVYQILDTDGDLQFVEITCDIEYILGDRDDIGLVFIVNDPETD